MEQKESNCYADTEQDAILEQLTDSISYIKAENIPRALSSLRKCEGMLESIVREGGTPDADLILVALHNTALCYQKQSQYEECSSYLDGCIYNAKQKSAMSESESKLKPSDKSAYRLRKSRYLCRVNLQYCAMLSLLDRHEAAMARAKIAVKQAQKFVNETYKACTDYARAFSKAKNRHSKEALQLYEIVTERLPLFEYLARKTTERGIRLSLIHI